MIYLASPYAHPDEEVRRDRFRAVCRAAGDLIHNGHLIYSPIAMCHPIHTYNPNVEDTVGYWSRHNGHFLALSSELWILTLKDWDKSKGIGEEYKFAKRLKLPVYYVDRDDYQLRPAA